ncbi:MAG: hypothetical protein LBV67_06490 [Streptococcaceae bacterium]|nr:hypothetical protein [Streptococcaceae bacterium]
MKIVLAQSITNFLQEAISLFNQYKFLLSLLVFILMGISWVRIHHKHKKKTIEEDTKEIEMYYEKNEEGLYPWEVDTDDDPKKIPEDATPISHNWGPQRGQW